MLIAVTVSSGHFSGNHARRRCHAAAGADAALFFGSAEAISIGRSRPRC
jgi:hypothetical protein